jgi:four helix bundle protein
MVHGLRSMVHGRSWSSVQCHGQPSRVPVYVGGYCQQSVVGRHAYCLCRCMKAKNIDDVVVYREALAAEDEVSAILERPVFGRDLNLKDQLDRSSSRVGPLIAEGFGQLTDRHLATYLARARGSASETRTHLRKARRKRFVTEAEHDTLSGKYTTIGKRLTCWIHYLDDSKWTNRG